MKRNIYVIGDIHGDYRLIDARFGQIRSNNPKKEDVLFVAGDAGFINSFENENSRAERMKQLNSLPFIIIVVLGNHENYDVIESLDEVTIFKGTCYKEDGVDVYYAKNGQIFDIDGLKFFTFNGGLSADRALRMAREQMYDKRFWWPQEIKPEDFDAAYLNYFMHHVDYVITHDVPTSIHARLYFYLNQRLKTETCELQPFLERIYMIKKYKHWYAGHYHPSYPVTIGNFTVLPIGYLHKICSKDEDLEKKESIEKTTKKSNKKEKKKKGTK